METGPGPGFTCVKVVVYHTNFSHGFAKKNNKLPSLFAPAVALHTQLEKTRLIIEKLDSAVTKAFVLIFIDHTFLFRRGLIFYRLKVCMGNGAFPHY